MAHVVYIDARVTKEPIKDVTRYCYKIDVKQVKVSVGCNAFNKFLKKFKVVYVKQAGRQTFEQVYTPYLIDSKTYTISRFMIYEVYQFFTGLGVKVKLKGFKWGSYGVSDPSMYPNGPDLWKEKKELVDVVEEQLLMHNGVSLKLDTGKGKTVIISHLIHKIGGHVCVICKDKGLMYQMVEDLIKNLQLSSDDVGYIGDGNKYTGFNASKKIYAIIINSAKKIPLKDFKFFNMVVLDEAHTYCAQKSNEFIRSIPGKYMMACSATIDKEWNHQLIYNTCGPIVYGDEYVESVKFDARVDVIKYYGPPEFTEKKTSSAGTVNASYMARQYNQDPYRNTMIVDKISDLVDEGHDVFVFSCIVEQVEDLHKMFTEFRTDVNCNMIHGGVGAEQRSVIKRNCKVIFYNYACGSTGLNLPRFTALLTASPYAGIGLQLTGRILRGKNNEKERVYVDIVDENTSLKQQYYKHRAPLYKSDARNFKIVEKKVMYSDIDVLEVCDEVCKERTEKLIEKNKL
jgi:superfamily II DNA or RNA helicase